MSLFSMELPSAGSQQMLYRNNQTQSSQNHPTTHSAHQSSHQQPQSNQQVFPSQYTYQSQQTTPYFATYPNNNNNNNTNNHNNNNNNSNNNAKGGVSFMASSQSSYISPQTPQQLVSYNYSQQQQQPPQQQQQQQPSHMQSPPQQHQQQHHQNSQIHNTSHQSSNQHSGRQSQHSGGSPYVVGAMRYPNNHHPHSYNAGPHPTMRYHGGRGRGGMYGGGSGYGNMGDIHRPMHHNYMQSHQHFNSNNAVPEKTATLHVIHPTTKKVKNIKLNRIYNTMADIRSQLRNVRRDGDLSIDSTPIMGNNDNKQQPIILCLDFLSPRGCPHGSGCDRVHIAGIEYMWDSITPMRAIRDDGTPGYEPGFQIHCYDPSLAHYYNISSECVQETKGSTDYILMYNEHGDNFKTKFKLCADMLTNNFCERKDQCADIHCSSKDFENVRDSNMNTTHICDPDAMAHIPRLPNYITVRVFEQNNFDMFRDYNGSNVLLTEGAKTYAKYYEQDNNTIPLRKRMQHCAHFRLKELCRLGGSCRFFHVLPSSEELSQMKDVEANKHN